MYVCIQYVGYGELIGKFDAVHLCHGSCRVCSEYCVQYINARSTVDGEGTRCRKRWPADRHGV